MALNSVWLVAKLFLISLGMTLVIKYLAPLLPIPAHGLVALGAVFGVPLGTAIVIWRSSTSPESSSD